MSGSPPRWSRRRVSFSALALLTAVVAPILAGLIIWWQDAGDGESPRERADAGNGERER